MFNTVEGVSGGGQVLESGPTGNSRNHPHRVFTMSKLDESVVNLTQSEDLVIDERQAESLTMLNKTTKAEEPDLYSPNLPQLGPSSIIS